METQFLLLGDLEVLIGGRTVEIGHARQQCVLATLLVNANQTVSADQLVERVWADQPPQRARNTLSGYLSRLRQVLAGTDAAIVRRSPGYRLSVDPRAVDLHLFEELVAQACSADDEQLAEARLEHALGLWRGEAFATLDTPWLNEIRESLAGKRLSAELDRNDLALRRGGHADLLNALCELAAAHPLDERLAGQLLLALYRSGRQADALARYEQLRHRLADELGVDPATELQHLYRRILRMDQSLVTMPARAATPRQLPTAPRLFAGRADELAELDALVDGPAAVVLSGAPGIGKTALAVHWGHRVRDRFPDGQLYSNLRGFDPAGPPSDPATAIRGFLEALGIPAARIPADADAQAALYRGLLADKQVLIILDNVRDAQQVRPLLPAAPGCVTVVTSRNRLTGLVAMEGAHPLALDLLSDEDARQLVTSRIGADRVIAEPDALEEIISLTTRLPLALVIAAAWAATHPGFPLTCLTSELRDSGRRLDALDTGDPATNIRTVFAASYLAQPPATRRLFRLLGLHPGPDLSVAAAASLGGQRPGQVRSLLDELAQAHLVEEQLPGRYTQHNLLRTYATELGHATDSDDLRRAAAHRLVEHYLQTAREADRLLCPSRGSPASSCPIAGVTSEPLGHYPQAIAWFTAEFRVLLSVIQAAGVPACTWQLAWSLRTFLDLRGYWRDWVTVARSAVAAADQLDDPHAHALSRHLLGNGYRKVGRLQEARTYLRQALEHYRRVRDLTGQAHAHHDLAMACEREDGIGLALGHARRALALHRIGNHRPGQAAALNSIGWYHALLGDHGEAITMCLRALSMFQDLGDRDGQAATWDSLGYAQGCLGRHDEAVGSYRLSIDLNRELGHLHCEAETLSHLGDTYRAIGDLDAARDTWDQALTILEDLDHLEAEQLRVKIGELGLPWDPV